jgi:hypothetical protein
LDATKGMIDVLSYLGITKKEGSFGGVNNVFSKKGFENYLANFVGGVLGGGLFEFNRIVLEPTLFNTSISEDTKKSVYELIGNGHKEDLIALIHSQKKKFGNSYLGKAKEDGTFEVAGEGVLSQADVIANTAVDMVNYIDGLMNSQDLGKSDEEVVKKAVRDMLIIKQLEDHKEGANVGLEGLVLSDYKESLDKVISVAAK